MAPVTPSASDKTLFPRAQEATRKRATGGGEKSEIKKPKPSVEIEPPCLLKLSGFTEFSSFLAVVTEVQEKRVFLSIPHGHFGYARIENLASVELVPGCLDQHFTVGEYIIASPVTTSDPQQGAIELSILPRKINAFRSGPSNGQLIAGCIVEREMDNFLVDIGMGNRFQAFVKAKNALGFKTNSKHVARSIEIGDQIIGSIKATISSRSFEIVPLRRASVSNEQRFNALMPGTLVTASLLKVFKSGTIFSLGNGIKATLCRRNYESYFSDNFSADECHLVVLFVEYASKLVYLTAMGPHLKLSCEHCIEPIERGRIVQAEVVDGQPKFVVLNCQVKGAQDILAFVSRSSMDEDTRDLGTGATIRCRVLQHNILENYLLVTAKRAMVDEKCFCVNDIDIGAVLEGVISDIDNRDGLFVTLSDYLVGRVGLNHIDDCSGKLAKLDGFKVGQPVRVKVLSKQPFGRLVELTMKPCFLSYNRARIPQSNEELTGTIPAIVRYYSKNGVFVTSFGDIKGFVRDHAGCCNMESGTGVLVKRVNRNEREDCPEEAASFDLVKVFGGSGNHGLSVGECLRFVVAEVNAERLSLDLEGSDCRYVLEQPELSDFPENTPFLIQCYPPGSSVECAVITADASGYRLSARKSYLQWLRKCRGHLPLHVSDLKGDEVLLATVKKINSSGLVLTSLNQISGFVHVHQLDSGKLLPIDGSSEWAADYRVNQTIVVCASRVHDEFFEGTCRANTVHQFHRAVVSNRDIARFYVEERSLIVQRLCKGFSLNFPSGICSLRANPKDGRFLMTKAGCLARIPNSDLDRPYLIEPRTLREGCVLTGLDFEISEEGRIRPYYVFVDKDCPTSRYERYTTSLNTCSNEVTCSLSAKSLNAFYRREDAASRHVAVRCSIDAVEEGLSDCGVSRIVHVTPIPVGKCEAEEVAEGTTQSAYTMLVPSQLAVPLKKAGFAELLTWPQYGYARPVKPFLLNSPPSIGDRCAVIFLKSFNQCKTLVGRDGRESRAHGCLTYIGFTDFGMKARLKPLFYLDSPEMRRVTFCWITGISQSIVDVCSYDCAALDCRLPAQVEKRIIGKGALLRVGPDSFRDPVVRTLELPLTEMMDRFSCPGRAFDEGQSLKVTKIPTVGEEVFVSCRASRLHREATNVKDPSLGLDACLERGQQIRGFVSSGDQSSLTVCLGVNVVGRAELGSEYCPFDLHKLIKPEDVINCFVQSCELDQSTNRLLVRVDIDIPAVILYKAIHRAGRKYGEMTPELAKLIYEDKSMQAAVSAELAIKRRMIKGRSATRKLRRFPATTFVHAVMDPIPDPAEISVVIENENEPGEATGDDYYRIESSSECQDSSEEQKETAGLASPEASAVQGGNNAEYERTIALDPHNSHGWISYMGFVLQQADIQGARAIAERALASIDTRLEHQRWGIWVAYLNIEVMHGTGESIAAILKRACRETDELKVMQAMSEIFKQCGRVEEQEGTLIRICRLIPDEYPSWADLIGHLYRQGKGEEARQVLNNALDHLVTVVEQVGLIGKCASYECRFDSLERGQAMFEKLVSTYPKRISVWVDYVDSLNKLGRIGEARDVYQRALLTSGLSGQKLSLLESRLKVDIGSDDEEQIK